MRYQIGAEYEFQDDEGTGYVGVLTYEDTEVVAFDLVDDSDIELGKDQIVSVELLNMPTVYKEQSYLVKFDTCSPVDVNVSIHHTDQTALTRPEIIKEALGYLEDVNIKLEEKDICEIEALVLREYGQTCKK